MTYPDIRQLRSFVALAESGTFTGASKVLNVTQSAISHSIRSLEESLDVTLVDRQGKKAVLTREGDVLYKTASAVLSGIEQGLTDLEGLRLWGQGRVRIGAPNTLCRQLIPTVLREFRDCFPQCEVLVEAGDTAQLLKKLDKSEIDLVVGLKMPPTPPVEFFPLFEDELIIAVSPMHEWAAGKISIRNDDARHQLILYSRASETYRLVDDFFAQRGVKLKSPLTLGDMEAIKGLAEVGMGGAVLAPWIAKAELESGKLVALPFKNPTITRTWGYYSREKRKLSLVEDTFLGILEQVGKTLR